MYAVKVYANCIYLKMHIRIGGGARTLEAAVSVWDGPGRGRGAFCYLFFLFFLLQSRNFHFIVVKFCKLH